MTDRERKLHGFAIEAVGYAHASLTGAPNSRPNDPLYALAENPDPVAYVLSAYTNQFPGVTLPEIDEVRPYILQVIRDNSDGLRRNPGFL